MNATMNIKTCTPRGGLYKLTLSTAFITAVAILAALLVPAHAFATAIGTITGIEGSVDLTRAGDVKAEPVTIGQPVSIGDIVRTKTNSKAEITFVDKSVLRLAPKTRIKIEEYLMKGEERDSGVIKLFRGKARAIVSRREGEAQAGKFQVHTPTAIIGVRGTDFFVYYLIDFSGVIVKSGLVDVTNPQFPDKTELAKAGLSMIIKKDEPPQEGEVGEGEMEGLEADTNLNSDGDDDGGDDGADDGGMDGDAGDGGDTDGDGASADPINDPGLGDSPTDLPFTDTVGTDTTPPEVEITSGPGYVTTSNGADFTYFVFDPALDGVFFELDGVATALPSYDGLAEGLHEFVVTATDDFGNSAYDSYEWFVGSMESYLEGSGFGTGSTFEATGVSGTILSADGVPSAYQVEVSGDYTGPSGDGWFVNAGGVGYNEFEAFEGYWFDRMTGEYSGDLMAGSSEFVYIGIGEFSYIGLGTGTVEGAIDSGAGTFSLVDYGLGTYAEMPIEFETSFNDSMLLFNGSFVDSSTTHAYLQGGTILSPFDAPGAPVDYYQAGMLNVLTAPPHSWLGEFVGAGSNARGWIAGTTSQSSSADGAVAALYIDDAGNAGIISGAFYGSEFTSSPEPVIGLTGSLTAEELSTGGGYDSNLFNDYLITSNATGSGAGLFAGDTGSIILGDYIENMSDLSQSYRFDQENFGVYNLVLGGFSSNPDSADTFKMALGGTYSDDVCPAPCFSGTQAGTYWAIGVDGEWNPDGTITGSASGRLLNHHALGTITDSGIYGTYDTGSGGMWEATVLGEIHAEPLAFGAVSTWSPNGQWFYGPFYGTYGEYSGEFQYWSDIWLMAGGLESPWTCALDACAPTTGPVPIVYMGELLDAYADSHVTDLSIPHIFNNEIYSWNEDLSQYTTFDGSAYHGFTGGVISPEPMLGGASLYGMTAMIYMDPEGNAGVLEGPLDSTPIFEIEGGAGAAYFISADGYLKATEMSPAGTHSISSQDMLYAELVTQPSGLNVPARAVGQFSDGLGNYSGFLLGHDYDPADCVGICGTASWTRYINGEQWGLFDMVIDGRGMAAPGYQNPDNENGFHMAIGGEGVFGSVFNGLGYSYSDGYWLARVPDGEAVDGMLRGALEGRYISMFATGTLRGVYDDGGATNVGLIGYYEEPNVDGYGDWAAKVMGVFEGELLDAFSGNGGYWQYYDPFVNDRYAITYTGFVGPVLTGASDVYVGGEITIAAPLHNTVFANNFNSWNALDATSTIYGTGAYGGYIVGRDTIVGDEHGSIDALINAIFLNENGEIGILKGSASGTSFYYGGFLEMEGGAEAIVMEGGYGALAPEDFTTLYLDPGTPLPASAQYDGLFGAGGTLMVPTLDKPEGGFSSIGSIEVYDGTDHLDWGIYGGVIGGNYAGPTSNDWKLYANYDELRSDFYDSWFEAARLETRGSEWNSAAEEMAGTTFGYGGYGQSATEHDTWIAVGEVVGNFNPDLSTFEAATTGTWMSVDKFIAMAGTAPGSPEREALEALRIPFVEIGRADFAGATAKASVAINDAIFFTHPANPDGAPELWGSVDVTGTYNTITPPIAGDIVPISATSGGSLSADFNFVEFEAGTSNGWLSTIENGAGTLSGGSYNGTVTFEGAASGGINTGAGTFSGTAAGIAGP
jgi:hypothetical protein